MPRGQLALAIALTVLSYAVLTGYDQLGFAYIGKAMPRTRIALTSFLAYAISNSVGLGMLSGASVRYRFYTRWGVTTEELTGIVFSYSVTFWLGLFALGGLSLVVAPLPGGRELPAHHLVRLAGWLLMAIPAAYVAIATRRRQPLRLWRVELPMPSPRIAAAQLAVSSIDWALAGAVLYVLLPPGTISFVAFLGLFLVAILVGMAEPRARRRWRVRRPDGAVAEAVSELGPASPGAGGVSHRVLPRAVDGRLDRARRR